MTTCTHEHLSLARVYRTCAIALVSAGLVAQEGAGQDMADALEGAAAGVVLTVPVLLASSTIQAHGGRYMWNGAEGLRQLEITGAVVVGLSTGLALVAHDRYRLGDALAGAALGGAVGSLVGRGIAQLTAATPEGRWGGLAIGMGVGAVAGTLIATLSGSADGGAGPADPVPALTMRLPLAVPGLGR